jgi:uncharacterized protein DUF3224
MPHPEFQYIVGWNGGRHVTKNIRDRVSVLASICLCVGLAHTQAPIAGLVQKEAVMSGHAKGTFEVKLSPLALDDKNADATLARMSIDKQFHGDLEGSSKGEMLSAGTAVKGSAGYVAIERVTGKLGGHSGSFVLQHSATMNRGVPQLSITVVPDSGTGELAGLVGSMKIIIESGKHSYEFEYAVAGKP